MFNEVEKRAWEDGYLTLHLKDYKRLHDLFDKKCEEAKKDGNNNKIYYWNALNRFAYMVFENLRFLHLHIENKLGYDIYKHLPTFMSTFMMGFPVAEYLRRMMCILSVEDSSMDKNLFIKIISKTKREEEFDEVNKFLETAGNYLNCTNIADEWDKFSEANEIRHTYTHAFRLPWWYKKNSKDIMGFPKVVVSDPNKIKDEIWEFVKDNKAWEKKISSLSATDFISGADLIKQIHFDGTKMANTLFKSFIEHINRQNR